MASHASTAHPGNPHLIPPTPPPPSRPRVGPKPGQQRHRAELKTPRLSVVLVNYRQWDKTQEMVRQLLATSAARSADAEIVIVDNHSPTHPVARRLRRTAGVSLRRWDRNHGFARAVN